MKKASITIPSGEWGSVKSKYNTDSLLISNNDFSTGSINIDTMTNASLGKRLGGTNYNPSLLTAAAKDQFEAIFSDGTHHLLAVEGGRLSYSPGDTTFTLVTSGYSATSNFEFAVTLDRAYFGNGITNQVYDRTTTYGGVSYTAPKTKVMGCQIPNAACTATLVIDSTLNQVPAGAHMYKITYLYYGSQESNGSVASGVVTADGTHTQVSLTAIPVGGYGVTARKVYRDNADGNYVLLATIQDNTTTTYTDKNPSGGAVIPSDNGIPPVFGLVTSFLSRLFFGKVSGAPTTLYYSAPGLPDIVYGTNFFPCAQEDPIQAIVVYLGRLIVLNRNSVGQILGTNPDSFRYQSIQVGVGCTDNRSVQIRTINGVPTLIWLSDKGFYTYNGSSINYISEPIEDLVNLNIQQSLASSGSNTQTSQTDFQGDTASGGIDLTTLPGAVTTKNPKQSWQLQADWEGGTQSNTGTISNGNTLQVPTHFAPTFATGTLGGSAILSGSNLQLPTISDYTGESFGPTNKKTSTGSSGFAYPISVPQGGTITTFTTAIQVVTSVTGSIEVVVWSDSGGVPGTILYHSAIPATAGVVTASPNLVVAPGVYWFGVNCANTSSSITGTYVIPNYSSMKVFAGGAWNSPVLGSSGSYTVVPGATFSQTPVSSSGTWQSVVYDTLSNYPVAASVINTGSFPASCSSTLYVDASNDSSMLTGVTTTPFVNANGTNVVSTSNLRYWRMRYLVSTTDNRRTPTTTVPELRYSTTGTWISGVIDCTSDVTVYNTLSATSSIPAGTGVAVTMATSADNISYTSYVAVGSASVQRYAKLKLTLTTDATNTTTPSVSQLTFNWTIVANIISSGINTGVVPSGWDIFQAAYATNGGTAVFSMRSAASLGGLTGAFTAISVGNFPSISPLQYVQWKIVITSTADAVPTVDSITINWFIGVANSIRVASLFYNRNYYLAAAEFSQTTNNLVLQLDGKGNWRVLRGLKMATLGLFFNKPYYGSASNGQFINFLAGLTDSSTAIEWDMRTKAFDFSTQYDANAGDDLKILRDVTITGVGTGATLTPYFSVDGGTTWLSLLNTNGASSFTTATSGRFVMKFTPNYSDGNIISGRTIMFRLYNNDTFGVEIHKIKLDAFVRKGEVYT